MTNAMKTTKPSTQHTSSWSVTRSPLVPHVAFWSVGLIAKILFPVFCKWLAYDSITTLLLSVWYPLCATISLIHRDKGQLNRSTSDVRATESLRIERQFWIEYWSVGFAGVQFLHRFISVIPSLRQMGRHDYPQLHIVLKEVKLLFFVWIFVMETLLARHQRYLRVHERSENWKKFVPLTFLTEVIAPRLMRVQIAISEQISKDTWQRLIQRKAQRVLEVMVVLQFLEEESMAYLLQLLEEGRSLLLLSVFMVLPSSISQVGMLYPQFLFPSARSLAARGNTMEVLSLKYWVLNNALSLFLSITWWLWWCVPLSNQLILGIRCFATFPSTITHFYSMVEMELITFGILSGEPKLRVKETKTVQALRAVVKRLPRDKHAQSFQFEIDEPVRGDDDSSIGSVDTTESERERRRRRRSEKRAKKRESKQKKLSGSMNSNSARPPPLLSEGFIDRYAEDQENDHNDDEGKYSSFINSNKNYESKSDNNEYNFCSIENEHRDARNASAVDSASRAEIGHPTSLFVANSSFGENGHCYGVTPTTTESNSMSDDTNTLIPSPFATECERENKNTLCTKESNLNNNEHIDRALLPSMTIGSNYSSSHSDSRSMNLDIATPTENVVDEVEVQVKATTGRSISTKSKRTSYPNSSEINLTMPTASNEDVICLNNTMPSSKGLSINFQPQSFNDYNENNADSGFDLSDMDTTVSSTNKNSGSFETPPRRSSRLSQLRQWQDRKREEEELKKKTKSPSSDKKAKKIKTSKAKASTESKPIESSSREGSPEKVAKKSSKLLSVDKKARKSNTVSAERSKKFPSVDNTEKKSTVTSPKRTSKKSKITTPTKQSIDSKSTPASVGKKIKKKTSAASPEKTTRSSKKKGEAPLEPEGGDSRSSSSSPLKTSRTKPRKVPNSQRKKKDKSTMFGSVLSRN